MHIYIYTEIHIYRHTYMQKYIYTYIQKYAYIHIRALTVCTLLRAIRMLFQPEPPNPKLAPTQKPETPFGTASPELGGRFSKQSTHTHTLYTHKKSPTLVPIPWPSVFARGYSVSELAWRARLGARRTPAV